jgi:hypothetical protein
VTLLPEVHDVLARAVGDRARRPRRRPPRRAGLAAFGALLVTGSAFAAATGSGWHPILGDDHRGHPQEAHAGLPAAQLAALGVLRRPQGSGDRVTDVRSLLRLLSRGEINGVHTDAIRLLRRHPYGSTILVPAERVGRHDPGTPSTIHRHVLCVLTGLSPSTRGRAAISAGAGAGQSCGDLRQLQTTGIGGITRSPDGLITAALVPDGVAHVVIRLRHHHYLRADVHDNFYEVNTGTEFAPGWGVRWIDAQGHTIDHRRPTRPSGTAARPS